MFQPLVRISWLQMGSSNVDVLLAGVVGGTGGASLLMFELASRLQGRGMRTGIVVPDVDTAVGFLERCRAAGIEADASRWLLPREGRLLGLADGVRFLSRFRAPVVHHHLSENVPNHLLLRAMDVVRQPRAFVTMHSPASDPVPGSRMALRWANAAPRHFHRVICVSDRARQLQIAYGLPPELVQRIANGVDLDRIASGASSRVRREIGIADDTPLVSVIARLAAQKRPLEAVAAFAAVASDVPDAHMVFVGSGPLESEVRRTIDSAELADRVHMVGQRTDIADWLAATTVWLLPTETEGFSVALIEALAAGCAILSTDCPGNDEVLRDGENSLVVPVGDPSALASALRRLLRDPELRDRLGRGASLTAGEYSLDRMVDAHVACYASAGRDS